MSRKMTKAISLLAGGVICFSLFAGCVKQNPDNNNQTTQASKASQTTEAPQTSAPKEIVTLKSIYPNDAPKGLDYVLPEINKKLAQDIGVNLELVWVPYDQYKNKIEISVSAGEKVDYVWNGSSENTNYYSKKISAPIDTQYQKFEKIFTDAGISQDMFDTMKIDGKIYGFPSASNSPRSDVGSVIVYREDLRVKYSLPSLDSIENIEKFFQTIKEKETGVFPIVSQSVGYSFMRAFGPERMLAGTMGAAAYKIIDDTTVEIMPVQKANNFVQAIKTARKWYNEGYLPKDILNMSDTPGKLKVGAAASINGSAMKASEDQGTISANVKGAILADQMLDPAGPKYISGNGGNAIYLTSTSKYPDKVVEFLAWVVSSQENYDLYCYGIEGKNYELKNNRISYLNTEYSTFPGWMFKNLKYYRFAEGITDDYIEAMRNWDSNAKISPLLEFRFNPDNVKTEITQFNSIFQAYSKALYSGTLDFDKDFSEIEAKLKAAGQDKIVEEAEKQMKEFLAAKK